MSEHSNKICGKCKESKTLEHFSKAKNQQDGLQKWCKKCQSTYYLKNIERVTVTGKEYRTRNREKLLERYRKYREENRSKIRKEAKEWREANRERLRELSKIHYSIHKEKFKETWRKNSERLSPKRRRYRARATIEALKQYGGQCRLCGEKKLWALTLAHINDDGADRRRRGEKTGGSLAIWLRKAEFPKDFGIGVECYNCNCSAGVADSWRQKKRDCWLAKIRRAT